MVFVRISIAISHVQKQRDVYTKIVKRVSKMLTPMTYNIWESHDLFSQFLFIAKSILFKFKWIIADCRKIDTNLNLLVKRGYKIAI